MIARNLIVLACLAVSACGGQQASSASSDESTEPVAITTTASVAEPVSVPVAETFESSADEQGWFSLALGGPVTALKANHRCTIERINGQKPLKGVMVVVPQRSAVEFNGWVASKNMSTPERFLIALSQQDEVYAINAVAGRQRPDVVKALKAEGLVPGFQSKSTLQGVPEGEYSIALLQYENGEYSLCRNAAHLKVAGI